MIKLDDLLRHHVTGAIERGEGVAVVEVPALDCGHAPASGPEYVYQGKPAWTFVIDFDGRRKICHACADARILDCGHTPSPHSIFTTGYGEDARGRICYACCGEQDRARMLETGNATLYLTGAGKARRVANWPDTLSFPVVAERVSPRGGGFGSQRTDAWFYGPDGFLWHVVNRGDNEVVRCAVLKQKMLQWSGAQYLRRKGFQVSQ